MERLLLRPVEAAEALGISRAKVYALLANKTIPSVSLGTQRRITFADLAALVERLRAGEKIEDITREAQAAACAGSGLRGKRPARA